MTYDLLVFPIIAGYYLIITLETRLKYLHLRWSNQKLLFHSILLGILLIIISYVITTTVNQLYPCTIDLLRNYIPLQKPYFGTSLLSLMISIVVSHVYNFTFINSRTQAIIKAVKTIGAQFEEIISDAFGNETMLLISLKNNKVYVGWPQSFPIPGETKDISIFPAYSGYRDEITKNITFDTKYLDVYDQYIDEGRENGLKANIVIAMVEVITIGHFSLETYTRFNDQKVVAKSEK